MSEMYWLTRLDNIISVCVLGLIIFAIAAAILWSVYVSNDEPPKLLTRAKNISLCFFVFFLLCTLFIPSKNDMLLIWGVGGTIEYVKDNDTAKQLPDKAINALDMWLDSLTKEQDGK